MTAPGNIERKVRQLDNDIDAIYGMLTTIESTQKRQHTRLNEIAEVQVDHTATLADQTATLAEHGTKLDRIIALLEAR